MSSQEKGQERRFLIECMELYRALPALWKMKSEVYSNRAKKDLAYKQLLMKYRERFPTATKEDVKRKFNSLRTNFRKEVKKVNDSKKSGAGICELYEPTLWYFKAMLFLQDQEATSRNALAIGGDDNPADDDDNQRSNLLSGSGETQLHYKVEEDIDDQMEEVGPPVPNTSSYKASKGLKRKQLSKDEQRDDDLISLACTRLREPENENLNLAKTWAHDLSQMDQQQQLFARKAINDILFEGRMGTLHRFSVQINANTVPPRPNRSSTP